MKKTRLSPVLFLLWFALGAPAVSEGPRLEPDGRKALDHVRFLASDEMGGRKSGTPGYERAAAYV
ncbi:MAG: hypothetical protein FJY83_06695, partial [Candidatus Aminicenantes bacterium]|nr:hypothetical protein [Candidatus Aminicenantes bacterium]